MSLTSLFSRLVGMYVQCIKVHYVDQPRKFIHVYYVDTDAEITVIGKDASKNNAIKLIAMERTITNSKG